MTEIKITHEVEKNIEYLYWLFDSMRNGENEFKGHPQSERDAFKGCMRKLLRDPEGKNR